MNLRRAFVIFILLLVAALTYAQVPPVQVPAVEIPPPAIPFAPWEEVAKTDEGREYLVTFPSAYTSGYPANDQVPLRVFIPPTDKPVPVVLILHYWGAVDLRLERTLAMELNHRGIAAAIMTLPYHLSRTPPGHRSGEMAIQPDPNRLIGTMTQCVYDGRRAIDYLATRPEIDIMKVGVSGTSLGAVVTGLLAAVEPRITRASFLLGGADLAHILWTSSRVQPQREMLRRKGFTEERLRTALAPIEPLNYLPHHHPPSALVIGGLYDTVVSRRSTDELIDALDTKNVLWIDTGHYGGIFVQHRLMREVAQYFADEFDDKTFIVPKRLYAPTVRLGFKVDTSSGLDLGIGFDLLSWDRRGDDVASILLTPRGPQLFAGHRFAQGISIGGFLSTRGAGVGILWSTVL